MKSKGRGKNHRDRKHFLRALALFGGISGVLALTVVVTRWSQPSPETQVAPAPVSFVSSPALPSPRVHKTRAKPHSPLRETLKERERIGQRLHEFGLKREIFAARGVAGTIGAVVSEKDLVNATQKSTFATVVTSDHSQNMVAYSKLGGDCAELAHLHGRAALKVDGEGKVIDGAYLPDTSPIPASVIGCKLGAPAELEAQVFVTIFTPSYRHN